MMLYDFSAEEYFPVECSINEDIMYFEGEPALTRFTSNTGEAGSLLGTWYCLGENFCLITGEINDYFDGTEMTLYSDGTFHTNWYDGSGVESGTHRLTTKFDSPAITFSDESGFVSETFRYEFLTNDFIMIYMYDDSTYGDSGYLFYRND